MAFLDRKVLFRKANPTRVCLRVRACMRACACMFMFMHIRKAVGLYNCWASVFISERIVNFAVSTTEWKAKLCSLIF